MSRHILYIINPISGKGEKSGLQQLVEKMTRAAGIPFSIYPSVASGDYSYLHPVITEKNVTDVVIAGGDGTVSQVINCLHTFNISFGILPCGSGNGLAFGAGIPRSLSRAIDIILAGKSQPTDAFMVNDHFACMLCGLGFDALVAHDFANDPNRGLKTYIKKTLSNFFTAKAYPFVLQSGKETLETEAYFISIANSNQFGNNFTIAPQASLNDGLLDVVIVTRQNKLSLILQTIRQVGGLNALQEVKLLNSKAGVLYFQTEALMVENPSQALMHIDGDPAETDSSLSVNILKNHYRLIVP